MTADRDPPEARFSLKRWSQRKLEASRAEREARSPAPAVAADVPAPISTVASPPRDDAPRLEDALPPLPPIENLEFDSDFLPFMQSRVPEVTRRQALKKLFRDPRFNVMDGLDVYIDDYSIPSPLEPEVARSLVQARYIFDPPKTRVNENGWVEDVPPEAQGAEGGTEEGTDAPDATAEPVVAAADPRDAVTPPSSPAAPDSEVSLPPPEVPSAALSISSPE